MDLTILNKNLDKIKLIDQYKSLIWTDRYYEYGDFELYLVMDVDLLSIVTQGNYIQCEDSEHLMIIESVEIKTDIEDGSFIIVSGRSLESILTRRIVWGQKNFNGNFQNAIKSILNEAFISPSISARKVSNFIFSESKDSKVISKKIDNQYTGDNIYDIISMQCQEKELGFKIILDDSKRFVFQLYAGVDRSGETQTENVVIFSPNFENIINSRYVESDAEFKNVTLVGGEGEGSQRKYLTYGNSKGLDRRELFTDARDISSEVDGTTLTNDQYNTLLRERGIEKLSECKKETLFDGQMETSYMFVYREDFLNGDVVLIETEYGKSSKARIIEIIISDDESGKNIYPTFKMDEK